MMIRPGCVLSTSKMGLFFSGTVHLGKNLNPTQGRLQLTRRIGLNIPVGTSSGPQRAGKDRSRSSNAGESLASKVTPLEATTTACSHWSSTASISQPSSNGSAVGSSSAQEEKPGQLPRQLSLVTDDIDVGSAAAGPDGTDPDGSVVMRRSRHHTPRSGLGRSRSQHEDVPRRFGRSNSAESISRGRVCVSPASSMHDLGLGELGDNTSESSKSTGTYGSRRSSSRSTKSARRRRSLVDILGDATVTGAPKVSDAARSVSEVAIGLMRFGLRLNPFRACWVSLP